MRPTLGLQNSSNIFLIVLLHRNPDAKSRMRRCAVPPPHHALSANWMLPIKSPGCAESQTLDRLLGLLRKPSPPPTNVTEFCFHSDIICHNQRLSYHVLHN